MTATVQFVPSESTILYGVPDSVAILSSDPGAIIYYRLDSGTPGVFDLVYSEPVRYDGESESLTITAVAYADVDGYLVAGPVISYSWTQSSDAWVNSPTGVRQSPYMYLGGPDTPFYWGADGDTVVATIDVPVEQIVFLDSDRDVYGRPQSSDFHQEVARGSDTPQLNDDDMYLAFSVVGSLPFNPHSKLILMDSRQGTTDITVANGPHMSLRNPNTYWRGIDYNTVDGANLVSTGHIRSFYNADNRVYAAYYFDAIDTRWVKSLSAADVTIPENNKVRYTNPLVFQWSMWGSYYSY